MEYNKNTSMFVIFKYGYNKIFYIKKYYLKSSIKSV